jgi:hypothetical protein
MTSAVVVASTHNRCLNGYSEHPYLMSKKATITFNAIFILVRTIGRTDSKRSVLLSRLLFRLQSFRDDRRRHCKTTHLHRR